MKSYLVDFENVKSKGLVGIDKLTEDDHVIIFYSENSDTISFEMHCCVMRAKASVEYMKVRVGGKNALDFQLSTLLGYMVAQGTNSHIFIISNDKGFDKLHDFWENTFEDSPECVVFRTQNIASAINFAKNKKPLPAEELPENDSSDVSAEPAETEKPAADDTAVRSMSAEIVVTDTSADIDGENVAAEPDEPKFIVPEQLIDKFKEDPSGENARKRSARRKSEESRANQSRQTKRQPRGLTPPEFIQEAEIKVDDREPEKAELSLLHPQFIAPGEKNEGLERFRTMEERSLLPVLQNILSNPDNYDKTKFVREYMPGVTDDDTIVKVTEAIDASTCKLDFHNLLMKQFEHDTSSKYYNMIKPHYDFAKRIFGEIDEIKAKNDPERELTQKEVIEAHWQEKINALKPLELTASKKPEPETEQPAKKKPRSKKVQTAPKKVDAAMKKRLHTLLDDKATTDEFSGIVAQINQSATRQQLYINMIQRFKKERGRALYGLIKNEYQRFIAEAAPAAPDEELTGVQSSAPDAQTSDTSNVMNTAESENTAAQTAPEKASEPVKAEPKKADGAMKKKLHTLLDDKATADEFAATVDIVNRSAGTHELYLSMIKRFGKKRGIVLYKEIKNEFAAFAAASENA